MIMFSFLSFVYDAVCVNFSYKWHLIALQNIVSWFLLVMKPESIGLAIEIVRLRIGMPWVISSCFGKVKVTLKVK